MGKIRKPKVKEIQDDDDDVDSFESDEIDTFYQERDDNLRKALAKTTKNKKHVSWAMDDDDDDGNQQDEVLAFDDEDSNGSEDDYQQLEENDENGEEEEEEEDDLSGAWGTSKKAFYNEDLNGNDEDAKLEEQEAVQIQKKYYEMLGQKDFGLDLFQSKASTSMTNSNLDEQTLRRHIILPSNLLELSSNDRLQLIRDQSPELEIFCKEFKTIFDDLKIYLLPLIQLVLDTSSIEEFQTYSGWQFVLAVLELYLTYCSYLSLYLMMKSNDINFSQHPILNDLEQYRTLCQLVQDDFQLMKSDLLKLCELLQERKREKTTTKPHLVLSQQIAVPTKAANGTTKKPSLRERMIKRREEQQQQQEIQPEVESEDEEVKPQKRQITYEIEKNKGLTAKRKKENRNPRVRHRNKYAQALKKRKSRVPTQRTEEERYIGEPTGIRAGIKRGIKLKS